MEIFGLGQNTLRGIVLVVLMVGFVGMVAWAWSSKRKETFHDASRLPLEEDDGEIPGSAEVRMSTTRKSGARKSKAQGSKAQDSKE